MLLYVFISIVLLTILAVSSYKKIATVDQVESIESKFFKANGAVVKIISFLLLIFLCLLTGARARTIGNDTENYASYFELIAREGVTDALNIEKGYRSLLRYPNS